MKKLEQVREEMVFYGEGNIKTVDFITVLVGKTLPNETYNYLSKLSLGEVSNLTEQDLISLDGIGSKAAERIVAAIGLGKTLKRKNFHIADRIGCTEDARDCFSYIEGLEQEHLEVAYLDTKNKVISKRNIFKGSLSASIVHPREIFKEAVKLSAASFLVAHNHPSGDPAPSQEDIQVTRRLKEAGEMMGIQLIDHIIIGDNYKYTSLREKGYI